MANEPESNGADASNTPWSEPESASRSDPSSSDNIPSSTVPNATALNLAGSNLAGSNLADSDLAASDLPISNLPDPDSVMERSSFFSTRTALNRGMNAYNAISRAEEEAYAAQNASPVRAVSPQEAPRQGRKSAQNSAIASNHPANPPFDQKQQGGLWRRFRRSPNSLSTDPTAHHGSPAFSPDSLPHPSPSAAGQYVINPIDGSTIFIPAPPRPKAWWEKQPYAAIVHILAMSGTVTAAWLLGILVAQILPGNFTEPPLQEAVLRKSSRFARRLWHFPQLWYTPTTETRIEAIPLPETGPVLEPINLPPIERQPLIDELNAIETEMLTLDRRMQTLENRLGKPAYKGADVESRVNTLRAAIDPPVSGSAERTSPDKYEPTPSHPSDKLLEIAQLKITLPSDALFNPGQSELKDTALLNQVLDQLVNYPPSSTIVIRSSSDDQGGATASRQYTLAQANALKDYLQGSLPDTYRWVTVGGGQMQPIDSNDTDTGRQRNRRIEILVDTRKRS